MLGHPWHWSQGRRLYSRIATEGLVGEPTGYPGSLVDQQRSIKMRALLAFRIVAHDLQPLILGLCSHCFRSLFLTATGNVAP